MKKKHKSQIKLLFFSSSFSDNNNNNNNNSRNAVSLQKNITENPLDAVFDI